MQMWEDVQTEIKYGLDQFAPTYCETTFGRKQKRSEATKNRNPDYKIIRHLLLAGLDMQRT